MSAESAEQTMAEDTPDTEVPLLETGAETTSSNGRSSKPAERLSTWLETPGTPQLLVAMLIIGSSCGLVAFAYDTILDWFLDLTWKVIPERVVAPIWESVGDDKWAASHAWVLGTYILFICSLYGFLVGASQKFLGCPGDLPETIGSFHKQGCVLYSQAPSMLVCSLLSVTAGGSLGPEAPLLCLCASTVAFIFQKILPVSPRMLRYCSLMGMCAGLAAFFGVTMGGVMFALEVPHRMGMEYFEVASHALAAGVLCLSVFRAFGLIPFGAIWAFPDELFQVDTRHILVGVVIGFAAAGIAIVWTYFTKSLKRWLAEIGLDEHKTPVACGTLGGIIIGVVCMLLPPVMFWGEFELKSFADPTIPLPHIWPGGGVWGQGSFRIGNWDATTYLLIALAKLFAISITLLAGFRGGFIFPLFATGAAFGTSARLAMDASGLFGWLPADDFPIVLFAMCVAAGLNTSITRTPLGTTIILTTLCGQAGVAVPALASALVALYCTKEVPFIMTQKSRDDARTMLSCSSKEPGDAGADGHSHPVANALDIPIHYAD